MILIETPLLTSIECVASVKRFLLEKIYLKLPILKGILYYALSILFYTEITPLLATALLLNITTLLEFFAQCNRIADESDQEEVRRRVQNRKQHRSRLQAENDENEEDIEEADDITKPTYKSTNNNTTSTASNHHNLTSDNGVVSQVLLMKHNKKCGNVV